MPRLQLWNYGPKTKDYKFIDRIIAEYFGASGTGVFVRKYLGVVDQRPENSDGTPLVPITSSELDIQDPLFLENRDRKYDTSVYDLRGTYSVQDNDFNMSQFGLFLTSDTLFIEFHLNDMINTIGRKLMNGDVLELPHQRDDALLDPDAAAINKFYVVTDANRASSGYSATWFPHIWRVKVEPMTNAQQFAEILQGRGENPYGLDTGVLVDMMTSVARDKEINERVVEAAIETVKARNFETQHFWVVPGEELGGQYPWIYAGDGVPPNGAVLTGSGTSWPKDAQVGDYFLRTDYDPHTLFKRDTKVWREQEVDYRRGGWSMAHRILEGFINNDKVSKFKDGTQAAEKQPLFKAVKPKEDF
jgi:hypothetical protein